MNELRDALPCPFCLSSNLTLGEPTCVECVDCGAKGPDFMKSAYVAVNAWNNRGTDKAKAEYVHAPNAKAQGQLPRKGHHE